MPKEYLAVKEANTHTQIDQNQSRENIEPRVKNKLVELRRCVSGESFGQKSLGPVILKLISRTIFCQEMNVLDYKE